jgi:hypothetical protein
MKKPRASAAIKEPAGQEITVKSRDLDRPNKSRTPNEIPSIKEPAGQEITQVITLITRRGNHARRPLLGASA